MRIVVTRVLSSVYTGDFAIARAMLGYLNAARPDWQLTVLCRDPQADGDKLGEHGIVLPELFSDVNGNPGVFNYGIRICRYLLWSLFGIPCLDEPGKLFVRHTSDARALLFCGGGSAGGYGLHNLVLHAAMPVVMSGRIRVPVVFTALGEEPGRGWLYRWINRWTLNQASMVIARDPACAAQIKSNGVKSQVALAADWAFLLSQPPPTALATLLPAHHARCDVRIGISLRDPGRYDSGHARSIADQSVRKMFALISSLLERGDTGIFVVSMNRSHATDDLSYASRIRDQLPAELQHRMVLLPADSAPEVLLGVVSSMDLFVSTRLHPTIFALSAGVPALGLHHAHKVRDMMSYFDLQEFFLPLVDTQGSTIITTAENMLRSRESIRQTIEQKVPQMRAAAKANLSLLEGHLRDG